MDWIHLQRHERAQSTFSVSLLGTQLPCYPGLQPEFWWWIFSWDIRVPHLYSPKVLFWKKVIWGGSQHTRIEALKTSIPSHGQLRETSPSETEENLPQRSLPEISQDVLRKKLNIRESIPLPDMNHWFLHRGTPFWDVPNTWTAQEGTSWPSSDQWPSQGAWLMLTNIWLTLWLESRHKATLFLSPDL